MSKTYNSINTLDVTYADSFAHKSLKVKEERMRRNGQRASKGTGELRIYCGSNELELDTFFRSNNTDGTFVVCKIFKVDLQNYYDKIKIEYDSQNSKKIYGSAKKESLAMYKDYESLLSQMPNEIELHFRKKYDNQHRYYIVLVSKKDRENYKYIHNICLPRVTRLLFFRLKNETSEFIYIKPYCGGIYSTLSYSWKNKRGSLQSIFRENVLRRYGSCVVTGVSDESILEASHIKEFAKCADKETKIDGENGFMMTPTIHKLFDMGYLSFDSQSGNLLLSDMLRTEDQNKLHISSNIQIPSALLSNKTRMYLEWRNQNIFISNTYDDIIQ